MSKVFSNGTQTWQDAAPRGAGWDAASNTTRLRFTNPQTESGWGIFFKQTSRNGTEAKGDGVTNVRLMRPVKPGAMQRIVPTKLSTAPSRMP